MFCLVQPGLLIFSFAFRCFVSCFLLFFSSSFLPPDAKKKEAERRKTLFTNLCNLRCSARLAKRARLPAFHRGSCQGSFRSQGSASGQATWDAAGALDPRTLAPTGGRRPSAAIRALPGPACPSPVSTSRAGHSAGGHDARAARERTVSFRPRAPHSLRIAEYLRERRPEMSEMQRRSLKCARVSSGVTEAQRKHAASS
jgi:hypothetical protein